MRRDDLVISMHSKMPHMGFGRAYASNACLRGSNFDCTAVPMTWLRKISMMQGLMTETIEPTK